MTAEEKKEIKQAVLDEIKAESSDITEVETVSSLDGVTGLPVMQGEKLVTAPLSLLSKPATDAATVANAAAKKATQAANNAQSAASSINTYNERIVLAMNGATARFDGIVENVEIQHESYTNVNGVVYDEVQKVFCGIVGLNKYCNNWPTRYQFMDDEGNVRANKLFLCDSALYCWNPGRNRLELVQGSGGGEMPDPNDLRRRVEVLENELAQLRELLTV